MQKLEFYKNFELEEDVKNIKHLLELNFIEFEISENSYLLDSTIIGSKLTPKYTLKLYPKDFIVARKIIKDNIKRDEIEINDFSHIEQLDNDELMDILIKPYDWSEEVEIVAEMILNKRGVSVNLEKIKKEKEQLKAIDKKGKSAHLGIQLAYLVAIFVGLYFGLIFTLAGFAMANYYAFGKKVSPNGERYYIYDSTSRNIGLFMLIASVVCIIILIYLRIQVS